MTTASQDASPERKPITVVAALLIKENRLLICQRRATSDFPGKWEFPGGKIEPGERPEPALRRELEEELGIDAEIGEEVWRAEHQYAGHAPVRLLFFAVRRYDRMAVNRVFEQVRWVLPQDLLQYDFLEADLVLVRKLAESEIQVRPAESPSRK